MKNMQKGFTLIELMIVVAIIGILAAVAIPQYQDYTKKAKIGNALTAVDSIKMAVALCAQEAGGVLSGCNAGDNGVPATADFTATKEVTSVTVAAGVITATLSSGIGTDVDGKKITWTPSVVPGGTALLWKTETADITNTVLKAQIEKNNK